MTRRTLIVTNDFPPRRGGIQSFVHGLAIRQPPGSVVVYASDYDGAADFDARQPFPVIRHRTGLLLPTPGVRQIVADLARQHECTSAWFGAAAPLGLLAPALRAAGVERIVATTHGHEVGWAMVPGARALLRRIGASCDVITYLGEYTRRRLAPALGPKAVLRQLTPGVDADKFTPAVDGSPIRARHGLTDRPVIVCVSRLVPRKGQDALIRALPEIKRAVPGVALFLVGSGPYLRSLQGLAARAGVAADVVFAGGIDEDELPAHFAAGDVFAMPCRTRRGGADVEGLGIVYLEASACGLPVIAGRSGGAADAVLAEQSGHVIDGRDIGGLARVAVGLLADPALRAAMGSTGRCWVERDWQWDALAARLRTFLDG